MQHGFGSHVTLQCADCAEALGVAAEAADRAAEADAVSDFLFTRQIGFSCTPDVAASTAIERAVGGVD